MGNQQSGSGSTAGLSKTQIIHGLPRQMLDDDTAGAFFAYAQDAYTLMNALLRDANNHARDPGADKTVEIASDNHDLLAKLFLWNELILQYFIQTGFGKSPLIESLGARGHIYVFRGRRFDEQLRSQKIIVGSVLTNHSFSSTSWGKFVATKSFTSPVANGVRCCLFRIKVPLQTPMAVLYGFEHGQTSDINTMFPKGYFQTSGEEDEILLPPHVTMTVTGIHEIEVDDTKKLSPFYRPEGIMKVMVYECEMHAYNPTHLREALFELRRYKDMVLPKRTRSGRPIVLRKRKDIHGSSSSVSKT
jgi:hypothetical protein